jgi:hypothetical protein
MNTPDVPPELARLLAAHFAPGASDDCSRMTTEDIYQAIDKHAPGVYHPSEVFATLQQCAYRTQRVGETLYWLVHRG